MKNFILLDHEPWTKWRKNLFYDLLEKAGINLIVWDMSRCIYPGLSNPDELLDEPYLVKVESEEQFRQLLKSRDPKNDIIVEELFRDWENRRIFKILKDYNFSTIKVELYGNTTLKEPVFNKIKGLLKVNYSILLKNRLNMLRKKIYNKIHKLEGGPSVIISSNAVLPRDYALNHPDYDRYEFGQHSKLISGDYIVFCDIFFPYHPDHRFFHKIKSIPDGNHYHVLMCRYFDFLEEKYGIPVIIAAHPKANYKGDEFGERKIIKYNTESLIKYSSMVTMHLCNTISYAVLGDKPIAFIATNDYMALPNIKRKFELLAEITLGKKIYNIETKHYQTHFDFDKIENNLREDYIYNYLTSKETEKNPNPVNLKRILLSL